MLCVILQSNVLSSSDRVQYNDLQSLLCATLQVSDIILLMVTCILIYHNVNEESGIITCSPQDYTDLLFHDCDLYVHSIPFTVSNTFPARR